jgi:cytoskeleton protein RodZ
MASLGQELKDAREQRGVPLRSISEATHIGMRFLQAIENDDYDQLPGGIFNKSFVLKYARQVGLDEAQVAERYDQLMTEKGVEPPKPTVSYIDDFDERSTSSRFWLPALIFMILCAAAYAAYQYSSSTGQPKDQVAQSATPEPSVTPTATGSPTPEPTPEVPNELRLRIAANTGDCWVRIGTDDLQPQILTLRSGETQDFVATDRLVLDLGNVLSVNIELNGKPMRLEPNVGRTRLKNVVITKDNYQQFLQ